jgi:hypothetical protein
VTTTGSDKQPVLKTSGAINSLRRISKQCGVDINQLSNKPWLSASKDISPRELTILNKRLKLLPAENRLGHT